MWWRDRDYTRLITDINYQFAVIIQKQNAITAEQEKLLATLDDILALVKGLQQPK